MTLSRDMSSNEHETNSLKYIDKSQEVSSTVVERNRNFFLTDVWKIYVVYSYNAEQLAYD